jgi:hypothetical protein
MNPRTDYSNMTPEEALAHKRALAQERNRAYRARHPDREKARRDQRAEGNKEYQKEWYKKNREKLLEKQKAYYQDNKEAVIAYQHKNYAENRESIIKQQSAHAAHLRATSPEYRAKRSKICSDYIKKRLTEDPVFRMEQNLRRRLRQLVNDAKAPKSGKSRSIIGCSLDALRVHLESLFEPWMNWDNYGFGEGKWIVDHHMPCASFDLSDPEQQRLCFHYSNLRPLCWEKNMLKSDTIPT